MVAAGATMVVAGTASASTPLDRHPVIRFWNSYDKVTMTAPPQRWCPASKPACVWILFVDEPDVPPQPVVGSASGTSGEMEVAYPTDFCGVLQADAVVGPAPL